MARYGSFVTGMMKTIHYASRMQHYSLYHWNTCSEVGPIRIYTFVCLFVCACACACACVLACVSVSVSVCVYDRICA